jgi:hypothetical protein
MPPVPPKKKTTPAQLFAKIFAQFTSGATAEDRAVAERQMDAWLKRHGKSRIDIPSILIQAAADDAAAQPPPPPSDPRDTASHPFDDPKITPADVVHGLLERYMAMPWYALVVGTLWIIHTHVFFRFGVTPRLVLTSQEPDSGKSTFRRLCSHLVLRPNENAIGSAADCYWFLDEGPGTVLLDEADNLGDAEPLIRQIFNLGFEKGAKIGRVIKGRRRSINIFGPILMACRNS